MDYLIFYTIFTLDFLFVIVFVWPLLSIIAILIGTILMQTVKSPTGIKYISLDKITYRKKFLRACLFILLLIFIRAVLPESFWEYSSGDMNGAFFGLAMQVVMGVIANYSAKRLRGMGYSHYWALLCAVPLVGPLMELWLAFTNRTKAPITSPDVFS